MNYEQKDFAIINDYEERELKIKDLLARLPYGVKCKDLLSGGVYTIDGVSSSTDAFFVSFIKDRQEEYRSPRFVEPYLRPMSSLTDKERLEYDSLIADSLFSPDSYETLMYKKLDWLNKKHIDYRGLIAKGIALEAPKGMYHDQEETQAKD